MPIYEYRCSNGHNFEVFQPMADDPVISCQECGAPVERVFHPIAVHFKGSGFYTTDYARKGSAKAGDGGLEIQGPTPDRSRATRSRTRGVESKTEKGPSLEARRTEGSKVGSSSD